LAKAFSHFGTDHARDGVGVATSGEPLNHLDWPRWPGLCASWWQAGRHQTSECE
jgi:hypothetical protein